VTGRPQLPHPILEHRQRAGPADPLGDHRGRHRRSRSQQLPDVWLGRAHDRPTSHPLVARRPLGRQGSLDGVLGAAPSPGDLLDRHPLGPMQPADLRPVLHARHPRFLPARLEPGSGRGQLSGVGGQLLCAVDKDEQLRRQAHAPSPVATADQTGRRGSGRPPQSRLPDRHCVQGQAALVGKRVAFTTISSTGADAPRRPSLRTATLPYTCILCTAPEPLRR
jgi:hypothetical protein